MLQFAKPLFDTLPTLPRHEETKVFLSIATIAWNLPILEQDRSTEAPKHRAMLASAMAGASPEIAEALSAMLQARVTTYGADPRFGFLEVTDNGDGNARIIAASLRFDD